MGAVGGDVAWDRGGARVVGRASRLDIYGGNVDEVVAD